MKEYKFEKGINIRMQQMLDQPGACGLVMIGYLPYSGKDRVPFVVVHEVVIDPSGLVAEITPILAKHGVNIGDVKI